MDKSESLVKGGCGHSDQNVYDSAAICGICAVISLLCVVAMIIEAVA